MEDIIQFLVIIGALLVSFAFQSKKKKKSHTEEAFPPIPDYEEMEPDETIPHSPLPSYTSSTVKTIDASQETSVSQAIRRSQASTPKNRTRVSTSTAAPRQDGTGRIDLRSSQKARQAFIYSEIFTRKYQ